MLTWVKIKKEFLGGLRYPHIRAENPVLSLMLLVYQTLPVY